jgi:imidazolonepropionase-like amidohydrolase
MTQRLILFIVVVLIYGIIPIAQAHDEMPGTPQTKPIALVNARIYTVTKGVIEGGTIVFDKGKITAIGKQVSVPSQAETIDCSGKSIYPGFFAPYATTGLVEIELVRATRDQAETGTINPNAKAYTAFNPESELIPTIRTNGILFANIAPQGGIVSGTASLMALDGWNKEDMAIVPRSGICVNFPNVGIINAWWMNKPADVQRKENQESIEKLYALFDQAKMYSQMAQSGLITEKDIRMEAMRPIFENGMNVFIDAGEYRQLLEVIAFTKKFALKTVVVGAFDAWRCADELRDAGIAVIIPRTHSLPARDEDGYDEQFLLPKKLAEKNVIFAFSDGGSWQQRNVPFQAGTAVAFGLSEENALKGLTIYPATIFGVQNSLGSLEVGKDASLFVSTGNAIDGLTNNIELAFIQGKKMSLENRHSRLAEKYRERYRRMKK